MSKSPVEAALIAFTFNGLCSCRALCSAFDAMLHKDGGMIEYRTVYMYRTPCICIAVLLCMCVWPVIVCYSCGNTGVANVDIFGLHSIKRLVL